MMGWISTLLHVGQVSFDVLAIWRGYLLRCGGSVRILPLVQLGIQAQHSPQQDLFERRIKTPFVYGDYERSKKILNPFCCHVHGPFSQVKIWRKELIAYFQEADRDKGECLGGCVPLGFVGNTCAALKTMIVPRQISALVRFRF